MRDQLKSWDANFHSGLTLLTRLSVGFVFAQSGYGKLQHLSGVIGYFAELGIAFPQIMAPSVAIIELVAGILLIVGIRVRFAAAPLVAIMAVALMTAKREDIKEVSDLFTTSEFLLALTCLWIIKAGAGVIALDEILLRFRKAKTKHN